MPVSTSVHITHCLQYLITLAPKSILDIGCGFGMWGCLARMYLDVSEERVQPADWKTRIDGVELFEPYIQSHQRALYSNIFIGDVRELAAKVGEYELIIAGDVIEHLHKEEGEAVIEQLYSKATRALLVNIPLGLGWDHPERHGNPGELHRSHWFLEDFYPYPSISQTFTVPAGAYGSFFCPKDCSLESRVLGMITGAEWQRQQGRVERALHLAWSAHELAPTNRDTIVFLADTLLNAQRIDESIELFKQAVTRDPTFHYGFIALAKIHSAMQQHREAIAVAQQLLAQHGVPREFREQAEALLA